METVDLGGVRLHVVVTTPGLPGEAARVVKALASIEAAAILTDMDTDECLRLLEALGRANRPYALSYVDGLFQEQVRARYAPHERASEHPFLDVARYARKTRASLIPMRPVTADPGWLARRRGRKVASLIPETVEPGALGPAFADALAGAKVWRAEDDARAAQTRLLRTLAEGRAPVAAVIQAHRAPATLAWLRAERRVPA